MYLFLACIVIQIVASSLIAELFNVKEFKMNDELDCILNVFQGFSNSRFPYQNCNFKNRQTWWLKSSGCQIFFMTSHRSEAFQTEGTVLFV